MWTEEEWAEILSQGYAVRVSQFKQFNPAPGGVLFLGDSITEGGLFSEWFPDHVVSNRGIGGDTAEGILHRLDSALGGPPSTVFLLIGTNDLAGEQTPEDIATRTAMIVDRIREAAPEARVFLQSVMPRQLEFRDRIIDLNRRYAEIAEEKSVTYLDLWPAFATDEGGLIAEYTYDELHLTGEGYRAWVDVLRPLL